jgi:hypothetical protein
LTLSLAGPEVETATASRRVSVLADPRSSFGADARLQNQQSLTVLQDMQRQAVEAVERIVDARADVDTVVALIEKRRLPGRQPDEALEALADRARAVRDGLDELEKRFRVPPETKGIVYNDDRIANQIGLALFYTGSSVDAPTPTADRYRDIAARALEEGLADVDAFMSGELADFSRSAADAGIGLFMR